MVGVVRQYCSGFFSEFSFLKVLLCLDVCDRSEYGRPKIVASSKKKGVDEEDSNQALNAKQSISLLRPWKK